MGVNVVGVSGVVGFYVDLVVVGLGFDVNLVVDY